MKRTLFQRILSIFGLSVLSVLFFTCHDAPQVLEQQKVKVTFTVKDNAARTVLPSLAGIASFKLLGGKIGTAETTLVDLFTGTGISVALDPGIWNFTLNAYNDSGENILQGKIRNKQINLTGTNQVSFSLSVINSGTGSIQITLNFPEIAGITRISTTGDAGSENFIPSTGGSFVYTKTEIAAGDYFINFEFYRGNVLRTVVSELVLVRNGLTSSKTITLVGDDLKPIALTGTVTINPAVSATVGTELTAFYNGTETVIYQWNKDGSAISNATGTKYTPNSTGSYTVTVSVAGDNSRLMSAAVAVVSSIVVNVPGTTLQAKLVWLANTVESNSNYVLEVSGDETIPSSFNLSYSDKSNIVITLKGLGSMRTITCNDEMFTVGTGVILILDNNITLQKPVSKSGTLVSVRGTLVMNAGSAINRGDVKVEGGTFTMNDGNFSSSNVSIQGGIFTMNDGNFSSSDVNIQYRGTFIMNGGTIRSVSMSDGTFTMNDGTIFGSTSSGVNINGTDNVTFNMNGGKISGNTSRGVSVVRGIFNMNGGEISNNTGVGVFIGGFDGTVTTEVGNGTFNMNGGEISNNTDSGVYVSYNVGYSYWSGARSQAYGIFIMNSGAIISGNTATNGGGVYVNSGTFTLNDGAIYNNTAINGGGVYVNSGTTFTLNDGTIYNNTATNGGGVYVSSARTFTLNNGTIYNNTATNNGGGVYIKNESRTNNGIIMKNAISVNTAKNGGGVYVDTGYENFTISISNGIISNNIASNSGGGLYVNRGIISVSSGTISGNTANISGGGVYVSSSSSFAKTSGTIYGYTSGNSNSNTVKNSSNTILTNKGHAVWVDYSVITIHKESTAGPDVNLSWNGTVNPPTFNGGWEY